MNNKLFSEKDVYDFRMQREKDLEEVLDSLDVTQINISDESKKIFEQFKLSSPTFDKEKISSSANIEDRMGNPYDEDRTGNRNPDDARYTATYVIPFQGDSRIFWVYSSMTKPTPVKAKIDGQILYFKIRIPYVGLDLPEEDKSELIEIAQKMVETIENNLMNLQKEFDVYNSKLESKIYEYLKNKKESIERNEERNEERNKSINPFN